MCYPYSSRLKQTLFTVETTSRIKILVTGANGQLGSELRTLEDNYPQLHFIFTDVDELDIANEQVVKVYLTKHKPHYIVNCAAYTAVDKAEGDEGKAYKLNALAPQYLASGARAVGTHLIHISTDYVFDGKAYTPYTETSLTSPNSVYGHTKLKGEEFVLQSGVGMVIRTAWLYSSFGKNFVKTIASKGKETDSLRVVFDQVGSPTWANDLAKAIVAIVCQGSKQFIPEVFHFSNEGVCSWYDLAVETISYYGFNCKVSAIRSEEYPTPAERPPYSVLDKSKIKNAYGVSVPHWRESLMKCLSNIVP